MSDRHVFISYCRENKQQVNELHDELVRNGFDVWWDDQLLGGQNWKMELRKAMNDCGAVVACFSEEVAKRDASGMFPELRDAIGAYRQMKPGSIFLVPVRLSECRIPDFEIDATMMLRDLQYIDLFPEKMRADGVSRLVASLSHCPLLKRSIAPIRETDRGEFLIAQKAFRVGIETDPIDEASTTIVLKGQKDAIALAIKMLRNRYGSLAVKVYEHEEDLHEVMIPAPVSSLELGILARRYDVGIESIDHVPEPFNRKFMEKLRSYVASDRFMERWVEDTAKEEELE
jgi:TIR domain